MAFDFVLAAFSASTAPPRARELVSATPGYKFAPLAGENAILSADESLWRARQLSERPIGRQCFAASEGEVRQLIQSAAQSDFYCIVVLSDAGLFIPPGSADDGIELPRWSSLAATIGCANRFRTQGFDVIDSWTGISALANIGFDEDCVQRLRAHRLFTNESGLFDDLDSANAFLAFATREAPEHAPFMAVRCLVCEPTAKRP